MCGISGIVGPATAGRSDLLRAMTDSIRHRGPDADGYFQDENVGLGMRRLSIIDVDGGSQPVFDETGNIVAIFNGEIYNFRELRARLEKRGHRFASATDSEVIPHLYEEYGIDFPTHLRGMFAIAVWDRSAKTLVLVRDRLGKKPLFYGRSNGDLVFASELKSILRDSRIPGNPSKLAISRYLTYQYVPAPLAAIEGVSKLPPGHRLVSRDGVDAVDAYWTLTFAGDRPRGRIDELSLAAELRERLIECVRARLVSDRPLGAFLSGGLDSSAIVAAMSQIGVSEIKTFSIGFEEASHNELPYARRVAERYSTTHHEAIVRPDAVDVIPRLARSFDEPFADASAIPSFYLAEMTRQHVVVALNGDGGDEAFGGYLRYPIFLRAHRPSRRAVLRAAAAVAGRVPSRIGPSSLRRKVALARGVLQGGNTAERYGRYVSYFVPESKARILSADFLQACPDPDPYASIQQVWASNAHADDVNRLLAVDTATYLPGDLLPKVDITTMSVSLEARSPLLDHSLFEWAAQLPGSLKVRSAGTKYLMKRALEPWLDDELIHRRKAGFGVPLGEWFRGPLREMVHDLLMDATARNRNIFNHEEVTNLLGRHMDGEDWSPQIYALVMLEFWFREVVESRVA